MPLKPKCPECATEMEYCEEDGDDFGEDNDDTSYWECPNCGYSEPT
jgi:DNA-directed RNA polymerase subunit RPC12/RpoP